MSTAQLAESLSLPSITSINDAAARSAACDALIAPIIKAATTRNLRETSLAVANAIFDKSIPLAVSRCALDCLIANLQAIDREAIPADSVAEAMTAVSAQLRAKQASYYDQLVEVQRKLSDIFAHEMDDYLRGARALEQIPLETSYRTVTPDAKFSLYIEIMRLYLEDDDNTSAESYVSRCSLLAPYCTDTFQKMLFKLCHARILDSSRKFLDASPKYHELCYDPQMDPDERKDILDHAVKCAVLAGAGPARSRLLATLYADEKTHELPSFSILEKMYLERMLRPSEVAEFTKQLAPHQKATLASGKTIFDRAVLEHNMLAASSLYSAISFEQLGALLGVSAEEAELTSGTMISEGRLRGTLDQAEGAIRFQGRRKGEETTVRVAGASSKEAQEKRNKDDTTTGTQQLSRAVRMFAGKWDRAVINLCTQIDETAWLLTHQHTTGVATADTV
ncbi:hypothetical protein GQ42DRAFT_164461 [Ramicandelaber brevisporus]|nr:hypothetical protein GQ42DRAFT_164461 [Ramicandelaber brevisporus]